MRGHMPTLQRKCWAAPHGTDRHPRRTALASQRCRSFSADPVRCSAAPEDTSANACNVESQMPIQRRHILRMFAAAAACTVNAPLPVHADEDAVVHTEDEWRQLLTKAQYAVLRQASTELPFTSPLNKEYRKGTFKCAGCDSALFSSEAKFDSGTGWPSFYQPLPNAVDEEEDRSIPFLPRTEVHCRRCKGHLGHVFADAPSTPTGLRYCMNGVAMQFEPAAEA